MNDILITIFLALQTTHILHPIPLDIILLSYFTKLFCFAKSQVYQKPKKKKIIEKNYQTISLVQLINLEQLQLVHSIVSLAASSSTHPPILPDLREGIVIVIGYRIPT